MNTKDYMKQNNYMKVETLQSMPPSNRNFLVGKAHDNKFKNKQGIEENKLALHIQNTDTKIIYDWTLGYKALESLSTEMGYDTDKWEGAEIKLLLIDNAQGSKSITATVIKRPQ